MTTAGGEKWTGGLENMLLDCPIRPLWELASDWAHWDRFYPSTDFQFVSELREGENRKPGCLRYAEVKAGTWTNERLLAIDNENHYFSYNMEDNVFCGGLKGYVAKVQKGRDRFGLLNVVPREPGTSYTGDVAYRHLHLSSVQFRETADGKTMLEHWSYEVEPLTTMTREAFTAFIGGFLSQKLVRGLEAAAGKEGSEKWTGGLKSMLLDCHIGSLWDLASDWAHWDRFYPSTDFVCLLKEGENRKPGCLRYAKVNAETWTNERLLAIDNENHYLSYNMEDNMFCGGLKGYVAKVQFRETADGKTMLEHWSYEVEPLTSMTREEFATFICGFLTQKLVRGLEAAAAKAAVGTIELKPASKSGAPKGGCSV